MPNQDAIIPLMPRTAPAMPMAREDIAGVSAMVERPIIQKDWDRKEEVGEDRVFDHKQSPQQDPQQQDPAQQAQEQAPPPADNEPTVDKDGHIDTFV